MAIFRVGQKVIYRNFIGKIISKYSADTYLLEFETPYPAFCHNDSGASRQNNRWYAYEDHITKIGRQFSKKTLVLRKCKKLWNESKWVKENPEYGY